MGGFSCAVSGTVPILLKSTIYYHKAPLAISRGGRSEALGRSLCVIRVGIHQWEPALVTDPSSDATPTPQTRSLRRCCRWAPGAHTTSKYGPDLGTHGLPRARARRGPHRPCPRVTDPASRPSQPSGACGRPARGAPRGACRAARGISASAGGVPARPPARAPAPAAPAGVGCAALLLLLLDGRPRVLVPVSYTHLTLPTILRV